MKAATATPLDPRKGEKERGKGGKNRPKEGGEGEKRTVGMVSSQAGGGMDKEGWIVGRLGDGGTNRGNDTKEAM